jgi:hypothetical protein
MIISGVESVFPSVNNEVAGVQRAKRDVGQRYDVMICKVDQRIMTTIGGME